MDALRFNTQKGTQATPLNFRQRHCCNVAGVRLGRLSLTGHSWDRYNVAGTLSIAELPHAVA